MKRITALVSGGAILLAFTLHPRASVQPDADAVYTSTREVTALCAGPDGALWAGTPGGVLRRSADGEWRKWTRRDGLPSHEVLTLSVENGRVTARSWSRRASWDGTRWKLEKSPVIEAAPVSVLWNGAECTATLEGLKYRAGAAWKTAPLPPSPGTHISALMAHGPEVWAALYGDGLWAFDGSFWRRVPPDLPEGGREVTALAEQGETLWIGTRRAGAWAWDGTAWHQHLMPDEPYAHNVQALALFRGGLYASTLEDGLVVREPGGWLHFAAGDLSSDAPRQMAAYQNSLYVRHGNGMVDRWDGHQWAKNVFAALPRKQVSALAAGDRLYLAQWGGWSEWDGHKLENHLGLPALQGIPVTAILPDGPELWIGTQGKGLAEVDRSTGKVRWHGAAEGLTDDWVTTLLKVGNTLFAGTFVGGVAQYDGKRWHGIAELSGRNVTALEPDGRGGLYAATRNGVYQETSDGRWRLLEQPYLESEAQALCATPGGLWVGGRTGLDYVRGSD